jgi:peptide-methionine (S)-S-oxide reductase
VFFFTAFSPASDTLKFVMKNKNLETATLAGGCFWCTEAIFKRLKGVESVVSGYSGGNVENPSYEQVISSSTGHAESIQIKFDPKLISFEQLLEVFFKTHDPTSLNRQGNDVGEQYRSAISYHTEKQKRAAREKIASLEGSDDYKRSLPFAGAKRKSKIVTQIEPFKSFYEAEESHKDYYEKNRSAGYCRVVIDPKITKLYKEFGKVVKEEYKNEE